MSIFSRPPPLDPPHVYTLSFGFHFHLYSKDLRSLSPWQTLLLSLRFTWTSIHGCPTVTVNSLCFLLSPLALIKASSSALYLRDWFHHPLNGPKQKPKSIPQLLPFPKSLPTVNQGSLGDGGWWGKYRWKSHFPASFAARCDHTTIQAKEVKAEVYGTSRQLFRETNSTFALTSFLSPPFSHKKKKKDG